MRHIFQTAHRCFHVLKCPLMTSNTQNKTQIFPIFPRQKNPQNIQKYKTMDLYDYFDESDEDQPQETDNTSSNKTGVENLSTDNDRPEIKKSKIIKKNYEPIKDGNQLIRYEDDPLEYKRLRKKIQNRESAARVRGRKKGNMENLEVEVEELKKINSELMLKNASLETENRSLKNQIQFLRGIIKPVKAPQVHSDPIDKYLNLSPNSQMKPEQHHFESPFEDQDSTLSWVRSSYSAGARSNWSTLFVVTIMVCVFVLPSTNSLDTTVIAKATGTASIVQSSSPFEEILGYSKAAIKYVVVLAYLFFSGSFLYERYWKRKLKKI